MTSPYTGLELPWISKPTCEWLINDRKIKMIGFGVPGIQWQYDLKLAAPGLLYLTIGIRFFADRRLKVQEAGRWEFDHLNSSLTFSSQMEAP